MGIFAGPGVIEDGLVLALDAANLKGYDKYENLLLYSEDFSNAYWTKSNVSVTSNAITSPTGSSNASKLVESASTAVHELIRGSVGGVGTDTYITFSIFAKAAERQYCYIRSVGNSKRIAVVVDLSNGTFNVTNWSFTLNSSATVTPYPNGWYRITATAQSNYPAAPGWIGQFIVSPIDSYQSAGSVGAVGYSYAGNGTSGIYIWGAHYEFGPGISDYYATTGTSKTRGTTWTDLSLGGGNNGTLVNGPTYNSSNRGSIVFDGTNDYVSVSNSSSLNSSTNTLICWAKSNTATWNEYGFLMSKRDVFVMHPELNIKTVRFYYRLNNAWQSQSVTPENITIWNMYACSWDGTTLSAYLNGNLINSGVKTGPLNTADTGVLEIGRDDGIGSRVFNGNIAQVSIYNRALTATEIQKNFNAQRGRFGI